MCVVLVLMHSMNTNLNVAYCWDIDDFQSNAVLQNQLGFRCLVEYGAVEFGHQWNQHMR